MIASKHTLGQNTTTWDYASTIVVEVYKRLRNKSSSSNGDTFNNSGKIASTSRITVHDLTSNRRSLPDSIHCYECGKMGHYARNCASRNQLQQMNSRYLIERTSTFENDVLKNIGRKPGPVMSHTKLVKNNSPVDTRDLRIIIESEASEYVVHDISLFENVHGVEPITVNLPYLFDVAAK